MASLHPEYGARVVLERQSQDGTAAVYQVTVYEPEAVSYATQATLGTDGVDVAGWNREPTRWVGVFVERLLKSLANKHAGGDWPRKITRWREER